MSLPDAADTFRRANERDLTCAPSLVALVRAHPEPGVRHDAALHLSLLGDRDAVPALEDALFDTGYVERRFDDRSVGIAALDGLLGIYRRLGATPEDVQRAVLLWASIPVHHLVVMLLRELGDVAAAELVHLFRAVDARHRESAAYLLGDAAYTPARARMRDGLRDPEQRVRHACAATLSKIGTDDELPALIELLTSEAPRAHTLVYTAVERCCPRARRFEVALAYASCRWDPPDRKSLRAVLARLYDGNLWTMGNALWSHLVSRHGPVRDAAALAPSERARLVACERVFWVKTSRDGHGGGTVTFHPARTDGPLTLRVDPLETAAPYVFTDESLDVVPWLDALASNSWERARDVPGLT